MFPSRDIPIWIATRVLGGSGAVTPWWSVDGATCVRAYQAKGAASYAASLVNLANPGTGDATTTAAPSWDAVNGWKGDGISKYLNSNYTPNNQAHTYIIKFSSHPLGIYAVMGYEGASGNAMYIIPRRTITTDRTTCYHGNGLSVADGGTETGILAVAQKEFYKDGSNIGTIGAGAGYPGGNILILSNSNAGTPFQFSSAYVQAVAIYSTVLTGPQIAALTAAMNAISANP